PLATKFRMYSAACLCVVASTCHAFTCEKFEDIMSPWRPLQRLDSDVHARDVTCRLALGLGVDGTHCVLTRYGAIFKLCLPVCPANALFTSGLLRETTLGLKSLYFRNQLFVGLVTRHRALAGDPHNASIVTSPLRGIGLSTSSRNFEMLLRTASVSARQNEATRQSPGSSPSSAQRNCQ